MSDSNFAKPSKKTGLERFHNCGEATRYSLAEFWRWSGSDLLDNTARGVLAEYIVALDLGLADRVWSGWSPYDLKTDEGVQIEVKSCAYIQAWHQKKPSKIVFGIAPTRAWDPETGSYSAEIRRWANVYVFCLLATTDRSRIDPLDLAQWEFRILPTTVLDVKLPTQKSVGLKGLDVLGATVVRFGEIGGTIRTVMRDTRSG